MQRDLSLGARAGEACRVRLSQKRNRHIICKLSQGCHFLPSEGGPTFGLLLKSAQVTDMARFRRRWNLQTCSIFPLHFPSSPHITNPIGTMTKWHFGCQERRAVSFYWEIYANWANIINPWGERVVGSVTEKIKFELCVRAYIWFQKWWRDTWSAISCVLYLYQSNKQQIIMKAFHIMIFF